MNTKQNAQDAMKNTQDTLQVQSQQNRTQQELQDTGANACVPGCGWLKLFRCFTEWEWYSDTNTVRLFLHLLLRVNYRERRWKGITIPRGSMVTSLAALAAETTLSVQNIRTCLAHLKSTGEISVETTPCYTLISVNNYARYQDGGTCYATPEQQPEQQTSNNPSTHSQQTPNKPLTTTKEIKKEINKENISLERERALERGKSKVDCVKSCAECRDNTECALSETTRNSGSTDYLKNRAAAAGSRAAGTTTKGVAADTTTKNKAAAAGSKAAGTTTKGGGRAEAGRGVFTAPSVEQVRQYAAAKGLDGVDAEAFTDYYTAKGWRIGLSPMRDWQAAVRNWARRQELMAECTLRRPAAKPATRTSLNVNDQWKDFVLPQR